MVEQAARLKANQPVKANKNNCDSGENWLSRDHAHWDALRTRWPEWKAEEMAGPPRLGVELQVCCRIN